MRPLTLRLQSFGSYAGAFEVDFARLGRHGVFSITGPTGAGKSTIFDAIVYALYDDLPGFRSDSHVRSQYADDQSMTTVSLTFEADGKVWEVERSPGQHRPRIRGVGAPVYDESKVVLKEAGSDGGGLTRKNAVNAEILRLIGLSKEQFEQVVLIPQGKFEEVLKADTNQRAALLGRLFPIAIYTKTTEALKELAAARRVAYADLSSGSAALVEQIRTDILIALRSATEDVDPPALPDPSLTVEAFDPGDLDRHRAVLDDLAGVIATERDSATAALAEARSHREAAEASAAQWDRWQADLLAAQDFPVQAEADRLALEVLDRARTVARLGPALIQWREATDALVAGCIDRDRLRTVIDGAWVTTYDASTLDGANTSAALAAVVAADAVVLSEADGDYAELIRRQGALASVERSLAGRQITLDDSSGSVDALGTALVAAKESLSTAVAAAVGRSATEVRVHELAQAARHATQRDAGLLRVTTLEADVAKAAHAEAEALALTHTVRTAWRAGLAGRLAEHLVDGAPCPTCGSGEHPSLAELTVDAPTDEMLQQAEETATRLSSVHQAQRVELAAANASVESFGDPGDIEDLTVQLAEAQAVLDAIMGSESEVLRLRQEIERLAEAHGAGLAAAAAEVAALQTDRAVLAAGCTQWDLERDAFITAHGALASTADAARDRRLLAEAITALSVALRSVEEATAALDQNLTVLEPTLTEFEVDDPSRLESWARPAEVVDRESRSIEVRAHERRDITARIAQYEEDGGPTERPDPTPLMEAEKIADDRSARLIGRLAVVTSRIKSIDAATAEVASRVGAIDDARKSKEEAEHLAAICAGTASGSVGARVALDHWVLAYYLRQVLAQANHRLEAMTGGRYALELNREYTDGRRPWGLDLSVLDAETGQSRPATTLSGGETFMAALSLSLGLADVVSAGSNYTIGALFVDEGFGSLDGDSLDTVIDVLRSLQDGGRMVGVISHVQELKDALPNGITIESTNLGSSATIHYPDS